MQMRAILPKATLIFLGEIGVGMKYAEEAALAVNGKVAIPIFQDGDAGSDFNDMALLYGHQAVRDAIGGAGDAVEGWPDVQTLMAHVMPEAYPLDAMPARIRAAVEEVAGYVQAPLPLVASSALAAVSLATQAHVDVQRDDKLQGPTSLYMLTIAASGERKSTCDGHFTQAIRTYEAEQAEAFKPLLEAYRADLEAWEMERAGIRDKIRQLAKDSKDVSKVKNDLRMLERDKPESPRVPRLMYGDATPEALAHKLGTQYPSGGVMAAEGGTVLGSHGMGRESATRNLAQLNVLWDGGTLSIDRRTSESFTVAGARLTIGLMVQEPALQDFLSSTGDLARGSGFLARFLVAWPTSTQGSRMYTAAPKAWPSVAAFNRRMDELLRQPVPMDEVGRLTPALMTFTPEAKAAWIDFYNVIEADLGEGGELRDVRDIASKTADNAARLAALFQHFEDGSLVIGAEAFEAGSRIAAWHLYEARRFYGELSVPEDVADAVRVSAWLVQYCQRMHVESIGMTKAMQLCTPAKLRKKEVLQRALVQLVDAGYIKLEQDGKVKTIRVNPALLQVGGKTWH
jgi:putative DNA primase/helicase